MIRISAAIAAILIGSPAWAQTPLIADEVFAASPIETASTSFGVVLLRGDEIPSLAVLGQGKDDKPRIQLLGCSFEIALRPADQGMTAFANTFSRKLTSIANADPPTAGYGNLLSPTPVGITDPVTAIQCSPELQYQVFLYRQRSTTGKPVIEALIFEFDDIAEHFDAQAFAETAEKPSVQARDIVRSAHGFYRVSFRSQEDIELQEKQRRELLQGMITFGPKLLLGLPLP
jgi:hypothetical protein